MPHRVVAPSLTPESYNTDILLGCVNGVVAPSLTPESYNTADQDMPDEVVVAPSLTPESYNNLAASPHKSWIYAGW